MEEKHRARCVGKGLEFSCPLQPCNSPTPLFVYQSRSSPNPYVPGFYGGMADSDIGNWLLNSVSNPSLLGGQGAELKDKTLYS